jgi:hypothetical protein
MCLLFETSSIDALIRAICRPFGTYSDKGMTCEATKWRSLMLEQISRFLQYAVPSVEFVRRGAESKQ